METLLKWMIWGYHYFRKHPFGQKYTKHHIGWKCIQLWLPLRLYKPSWRPSISYNLVVFWQGTTTCFVLKLKACFSESPCCHAFTLNSEFLPSGLHYSTISQQKNLTKYLLVQAFQVPILIYILEGLGHSVPWIIFWKPKNPDLVSRRPKKISRKRCLGLRQQEIRG